MLYPTLSNYSDTIRHPQIAFKKKDPKTKQEKILDPDLVKGKPVEIFYPNRGKTIWSDAGGFACVFKFETYSPQTFWAVRCFTKSANDISLHYQRISNNIKNIQGIPCASYFIDFTFLEEGIRVDGNCYPIVKMEWVEGKNLKSYIRDNLNNSQKLNELANAWIEFSIIFFNAEIAHGDLQHNNIFIDERNGLNIKLIDYDSLYFSTDGNSIPHQIAGIPDYQHPVRGYLQKQCRELDFFSQLVIYLSLVALAEKNTLWHTYKLDNKDNLLFSHTDFQKPDLTGNIFAELSKLSPSVASLASEMKKISKLQNFSQIPPLETVLTSVGILKTPITWNPNSTTQSPKTAFNPATPSVTWNLNSTTQSPKTAFNPATPSVSWNPNSTTQSPQTASNRATPSVSWNPNSTTQSPQTASNPATPSVSWNPNSTTQSPQTASNSATPSVSWNPNSTTQSPQTASNSATPSVSWNPNSTTQSPQTASNPATPSVTWNPNSTTQSPQTASNPATPSVSWNPNSTTQSPQTASNPATPSVTWNPNLDTTTSSLNEEEPIAFTSVHWKIFPEYTTLQPAAIQQENLTPPSIVKTSITKRILAWVIVTISTLILSTFIYTQYQQIRNPTETEQSR